MIGKQEDLRQYGDLSRIGWFWNWFLGHTIAHGYKSHQALWISLGIMAFGMIPFHFGYSQGLIEPSELEAYSIAITNPPPSESSTEKPSPAYPEFFTPVYSLDVFLPIIDFHQEQFWLPKASRGAELFEVPILLLKVRTGGLLLAYFWLHILFGWVFTSLWVAGFTGLVRRLE